MLRSHLILRLIVKLIDADKGRSDNISIWGFLRLDANQPNKQFNSDSQRLAFSLRVEFSVYGTVVKFGVCAAHTLIGR